MKLSDKNNLYMLAPIIVLIVLVGIRTKYNLLYMIIAGLIGAAIGYGTLKLVKK